MAGNKINTKTKGKEDKNKSKSVTQSSEENEDLDFSLLRKPILTSITGFAQARKLFDIGTEELKGLLSKECDLLYECKVCRNIFRSLANFISHKRIYCKQKFNSNQHGHFFKTNSAAQEMMKIKQLEETYLASLNTKNEPDGVECDENESRIPLTKDLTTLIEKIAKNKEVQEKCDNQTVSLQKIPNTSVAVFQNLESEKQDKMKAQVKELDDLLSKDKAVLQSDGNFKIQSSIPDTDNVIQISDDDEETTVDLKCKICDQNFSTQKTLRFHMKYKHLESRLVYPCPDCLEIFSTSWSVYRHLFKVHRKTAAQIRRLRESIQAKAFKMNNPPAFYEKRKNMKPVAQKISEEERLDQENQAWMDNVEGDGSVPRCFGCGRTFERRAALAAHAHTCQPRSRALAPAHPHPHPPHPRRLDAKRIEIQIRKDYHKGPPAAPPRVQGAADNKSSNEEITPPPKQAKDTEEKENEKQVENDNSDDTPMEIVNDDEKSNDTTTESPEKSLDGLMQFQKSHVLLKLPFAHQAEKSNLTAFRQRIQPDIEVNTLLCKKCDIQHNTVQELYDHMAGHYKWMRYGCKLCNFKTYYFSKLPEHLKMVHKLKGDIDFYFSTVKAIDGNEATELSENVDDSPQSNDVSPDSRRQSRCSSDSSRLSDDSSSSSTRTELGSRKRKIFSNKASGKRKKEPLANDDDDSRTAPSLEKDSNSITMDDSSSLSKHFEENSSDMDDIEEKISKSRAEKSSSVASRRPVRKKIKRKNEDFEYDLSNLLKMEAQGYRDSQATSANTKTTQNKKKANQESINYYEIINRDCCGAMVTMTKKSVELSAAHIKNTSFNYVTQKDPRSSNIFVRPMIPKIISRTEKSSPQKKDTAEDSKDSPQKESTVSKNVSEDIDKEAEVDVPVVAQDSKAGSNKDQNTCNSSVNDAIKPNLSIPAAVLPIKFRRESLELLKNPLINKNMTDFKKAGMKTKILVIKPINRNKDGTPVPKTPLKFQTIKLKDPSKSSSSSEENPSDQVMVVKVPKVDNIARNITDTNATNKDKAKVNNTISNSLNNNVANNEHDKNEDTSHCTESSPVKNDENEGVQSNSIPNEKNVVSEYCKPVSDAKELNSDKETLENEPDTT